MLLGLRVVGSALAQIGRHFTMTIVANLAAIVMSLPLLALIGALAFTARSFGLIPVGVVLFLGVLPNPFSVGLQVATRGLVDRYVLTPAEYFAAFREYSWLALKVWIPATVISIVIGLNVLFYLASAGNGSNSALFTVIGFVWMFVFFMWVSLHLYVFPLLLRHEDRRILPIYRNAALMTISRMRFTTTVVLLWLLVLAFSAGTGLVTFVGLGLAAAIQQNAFSRQFPTFYTVR